MIGKKNVEISMEYLSYHNSPNLVKEVWEMAKDLNITEFKHKIGPPVYDDHYPFIAAGFDAIDIIDFDYPQWHTLQDTPDFCSEESLSAVGRVMAAIIYSEE